MKEMTESEKLELKKSYEIKWKTLFYDTFEYWFAATPCEKEIVYPCYACKHIFQLKSSLIDHVNRRGIKLSYNCTICANPTLMVFYNPCALLLHARTHYNSAPEEIDLDNITISMLPFSMIGLNPEVCIPLIYDVVEDNIGQNTTISTAFYSASPSTLGQRVVKLKPNLFQYDSPTKQNPKGKLFLKQISLNIPHCMFVMQDHMQVTIKFDKPTNELKHVQLHSALTICLDCSKLVLPEKRAQHYLGDNRLLPDKICDLCQYIACSPCQLTAHHRLHSKSPPHTCPDCGNIFETHTILSKHLNEQCFHFNKQIQYICDINSCGIKSMSVKAYNDHLTKHVAVTMVCNICRRIIITGEFINHSRNFHRNNAILIPSLKCLACKDILNPFKTDDSSVMACHVRKHGMGQRLYIYTCTPCSKDFNSRLDYYEHINKCTVKQLLAIPLMCKFCEKIIKTEYDVDKHFDDCIRNIKVKCILCGEKVRMLQIKHHMGDEIFRISMYKDFVDVETEENGLIKCKYQQPIVKVEPYKGPTTLSNKRNQSDDKKQAIETNLPSTIGRCRCCGFNSMDRTVFHKHIKDHRNESLNMNRYQCMECGLLFVIKHTLVKHLQNIHQIYNVYDYFCDNEYTDNRLERDLRDNATTGSSSTTVVENKCMVCKIQFRHEAALQRHTCEHAVKIL